MATTNNVQPVPVPAAQSAASDIYGGQASQQSITADKQAFTGKPGEFWTQVDTALQARGDTAAQAHDSIRQAQSQFDPAAYDVGLVSDELAGNQDVDQAGLQKAVADYVKETGRTAGDFYTDLVSDLQGVNGISAELAQQEANKLAGVQSPSTSNG